MTPDFAFAKQGTGFGVETGSQDSSRLSGTDRIAQDFETFRTEMQRGFQDQEQSVGGEPADQVFDPTEYRLGCGVGHEFIQRGAHEDDIPGIMESIQAGHQVAGNDGPATLGPEGGAEFLGDGIGMTQAFGGMVQRPNLEGLSWRLLGDGGANGKTRGTGSGAQVENFKRAIIGQAPAGGTTTFLKCPLSFDEGLGKEKQAVGQRFSRGFDIRFKPVRAFLGKKVAQPLDGGLELGGGFGKRSGRTEPPGAIHPILFKGGRVRSHLNMIRGYGGNRKLRLDKKFEIQGEGGSSGTSGIIDKIIATYRARKEIAKYSHRALYTEIEENEFNLNIPRYVDTFEPEPEIDIAASQKEIEEIEAKLAVTRKKMAAYLKDLDF